MRRKLPRRDTDRGSSVAEFAMIIVLVLGLFLGLVQVCLWAYTRTLLTAAAADTARHAGLAGATDTDLTARVAGRLGAGLAGGRTASLRCTGGVSGALTEVRCTLDSPGLVGLLDGALPRIDVTGHSAREIS